MPVRTFFNEESPLEDEALSIRPWSDSTLEYQTQKTSASMNSLGKPEFDQAEAEPSESTISVSAKPPA